MVYDDLLFYMARRLRERRQQQKMSLLALSKETGIPFRHIHKYEHAQLPMTVVQWYFFAHALDVDPMYFVKGFKQTPRDKLLQGDFVLPNTINKELLHQRFSLLSPLQILLIEDDSADAYMFQEALQQSGVRAHVTVIPDGKDALVFLRDNRRRRELPFPHLIFMELKLRSLNGHTLLHALKKDPTVCHIPVIIVTKSIWYADLVTSYHEQAAGYICKPFDSQTFKCMMEACVMYWLPYVRMCQQNLQGEDNQEVMSL